MKSVNANKINRKSGEAEGPAVSAMSKGTCGFSYSPLLSGLRAK